jgi:hypothetical protein
MSALPLDTVEHILSYLRPRHACRAAATCRRWAGLYRCADIYTMEPAEVDVFTAAIPFLRSLRLSVLANVPWKSPTPPQKSALRWAARQTWPVLSHLALDLRGGGLNQDAGPLQTLLLLPNLTFIELRFGLSAFDDATKRMVTDALLWHATVTRPAVHRRSVNIRAHVYSADALTLCKTALAAGFTDVEYADDPPDLPRNYLPMNGDLLLQHLADNSTGGFASCASLRLTFHCLGEVPNGFVTVLAAERSLRRLSLRVRHGRRMNNGLWDAWQPDENVQRRRPDLGNSAAAAAPNHHLRHLRLELSGVAFKRTDFARLWSGAMRHFDALDVLEIDVRNSAVLDTDLRACAREIGPTSPRCVRLRMPSGLSRAEGQRALQTAADRAGRGAIYHLETATEEEGEEEESGDDWSSPRKKHRYYCNARVPTD